MYVVIRTDDMGRVCTVDNTVRMGQYAASRLLDDVHARYELLDGAGMCRCDRVSDTVLLVQSDAGTIRYEVAAIQSV